MTHENLFALDLVYKVMFLPELSMRPTRVGDGDDDCEPFQHYYTKILRRYIGVIDELRKENPTNVMFPVGIYMTDPYKYLGFIQFLDNNYPQTIPRKDNHFFIDLSIYERVDFLRAIKDWDTNKTLILELFTPDMLLWGCEKVFLERHLYHYRVTPKRTEKQKRTREKYLDRKKRAKKND